MKPTKEELEQEVKDKNEIERQSLSAEEAREIIELIDNRICILSNHTYMVNEDKLKGGIDELRWFRGNFINFFAKKGIGLDKDG